MKRFLKTLLQLVATKQVPSKNYSVEEMRSFIRSAYTREELAKVQTILGYVVSEYTNTEYINLLSEVMYQRLLFATLHTDFHHDYYPAFSICNHIITAPNYLKLDTINLHLNIYSAEYMKRGVSSEAISGYYRMIKIRKRELLNLTKTFAYDTSC
ncbi:MAG TPA: hypothetical protein VF581_07885 [Flavobacterium sp.]|jgi:hypothetical protein